MGTKIHHIFTRFVPISVSISTYSNHDVCDRRIEISLSCFYEIAKTPSIHEKWHFLLTEGFFCIQVAHERLLVLNRAQTRKITTLARDNAHFQKQIEELTQQLSICKTSSSSADSMQQAMTQRWQVLMPPRNFIRTPLDGRKQRQASFGIYR